MEDVLDGEQYRWDEKGCTLDFVPFPHITVERVAAMEQHVNDQGTGEGDEKVKNMVIAVVELIKGRTDKEIQYIKRLAKENEFAVLFAFLPAATSFCRQSKIVDFLRAHRHGFGHEWIAGNAKKVKGAGVFGEFCAHKKLYLDVNGYFGDEIMVETKQGKVNMGDKKPLLETIYEYVQNAIPEFDRDEKGRLTDMEYARFATSFAYLKHVEGGLVDDTRKYTSYDFLKELNIKLTPKQKMLYAEGFGAVVGDPEDGRKLAELNQYWPRKNQGEVKGD